MSAVFDYLGQHLWIQIWLIPAVMGVLVSQIVVWVNVGSYYVYEYSYNKNDAILYARGARRVRNLALVWPLAAVYYAVRYVPRGIKNFFKRLFTWRRNYAEKYRYVLKEAEKS